MKRPQRYLLNMIVFIAIVAVIVGALIVPLREAFLANAPLNGLILVVLLAGIIYNFSQVLRIYPAVSVIKSFQDKKTKMPKSVPRIVAPMATMLAEKKGRMSLSTLSMRSLLDGIGARLDEARDISRYAIGLLIFLGLLGTFWGLLQTVSSVGDVIRGLSVEGGDATAFFGELQRGLESPLSGMSTAFSSSLFGLAGSLILGFLDLQAGQAQNRFYNDMEDWLSSFTRLSSGGIGGEGGQPVPVYVEALLEQTAESLENLQNTLSRAEETRIETEEDLSKLVSAITALNDNISAEQKASKALIDTQNEIRTLMNRLVDATLAGSGGMDDTTRKHIQSMDVSLAKLAKESTEGREKAISEIRSEIKLLARTIAGSGKGSN